MEKVLFKASLIIFLIVFLLLTYCAKGPREPEAPKEPIDLEGLRSAGDDWTSIKDKLPHGETIRLHQDEWLMYFLHWRPLTKERKDISIEYVRKLMLSLWGPEMPFTFSENAGEMEVAGHKAYFVDGTIYEGAVLTRFIVWNCPKTGRQFIADCNINVQKGTPQELLDLQKEITLSISCHGQENVREHPLLTKRFTSEKYKISFFLPENWRTNDYNDPEWFPQGMSDTNGTFWTLLTDSEKYLELRWHDRVRKLSNELFNWYIEQMEKDSVVSNVTLKLINFKVESILPRKDYLIGEGTFEYRLKGSTGETTKPFKFKAFLWTNYGKTYFLLASMVSLRQFWNMPLDLSPTDETFEEFVRDEVLSHTKVFDKKY